MHIIIAGQGNFAGAIFAACKEFNISCAPFDPKADRVDTSVAIHVGSGKRLQELLDYCEPLCIPIIQASTGQILPKEVKVPFVNVPNTALPVLHAMSAVGELHRHLRGLPKLKVCVKESHQATKITVPGTAAAFAKAVGLEQGDVSSIRDPEQQRDLGVPEANLDRHGYHWITWEFPDMGIEFRTWVHGLRPYAYGALALAGNMLLMLPSLEPKVLHVSHIL